MFADKEVLEENMRGRLMNRKGKSARGRKRANRPPKVSQVCSELDLRGIEGWEGRRTTYVWFVEWRLHCAGYEATDGANFVFRKATAKKDTVRKWAREELKKQQETKKLNPNFSRMVNAFTIREMLGRKYCVPSVPDYVRDNECFQCI